MITRFNPRSLRSVAPGFKITRFYSSLRLKNSTTGWSEIDYTSEMLYLQRAHEASVEAEFWEESQKLKELGVSTGVEAESVREKSASKSRYGSDRYSATSWVD